MVGLHGLPHPARVLVGIDARRGGGELRLLARELALADGQQLCGRQVDEFLGAVARLDVGDADRVRAVGVRQHLGLELVAVGDERLICGARLVAAAAHGSSGRAGREGQRQVVQQQVRDPVEHRDGALDEHPRRSVDVGARRRQKSRAPPCSLLVALRMRSAAGADSIVTRSCMPSEIAAT